MAARSAGAESIAALWDLLVAGDIAVGPVPPGRLLDLDPGNVTIEPPRLGILKGIDQFDASFFGISPRMAAWMDPQQRILLELTWHALEHAGIDPYSTGGSPIAVVSSSSRWDYETRMNAARTVDAAAFTGTMSSYLANRISYQFDWTGPSYVVDSACSSGMSALCLAVKGLQNGEYPMAVVAGSSLIMHGFLSSTGYRARALSPTGKSVPFSPFRDGYVRGEGGVCLILKTLTDARRDGDPIHGIIRGVGLRHNGRAGGLTGTDVDSQARLTQQVVSSAGLSVAQLGYVEAHGTGTDGDITEIDGLRLALAAEGATSGSGPEGKVWVGSIKPSIGHLESASGLIGVVKGVLMLRNGAIPPTAGLLEIAPQLDLGDDPVALTTRGVQWPGDSRTPRRLAVNSFGLGGSIGQVILEQPPIAPDSPSGAATGPMLFPLSAKTPQALEQLSVLVRKQLSTVRLPPASVAWTLQNGRAGLPVRKLIVAGDLDELCAQLDASVEGELVGGRHPLGEAWLEGKHVDWRQLWASGPHPQPVELPGYPFQHRSHWFPSDTPPTN